ncbi:MAG TPA: hypothetical protein PK628_07765, partial [Chitinophagales bacterium]|nr:hypothetical protein [Chitinophagales bacterium]
MAKNKSTNTQKDILEKSDEQISQVFSDAEYFFDQYKNIIIGVIAAVILGIGGWWAYNNLVKGPKESKAQDAIIYAQRYFDIDSMQLALKGDGKNIGF